MNKKILTVFLLIILKILLVKCESSSKPHIIVIIADDMGYNDVGYRGSNQIPTPNIDALGYNGIILDKFYTQPTCTPSRTAFLTGNYPLRSGMQGLPISTGEDRSLPHSMPTMAQKLKKLGYKTHLVGKWHLGAARKVDTPLGKGFDTHYGYWNGFCGYFNYMASSSQTPFRGFDLHDNFQADWPSYGTYATEQFTKKSLDVINNHNTSEPLFLVLSHLAAHTGDNGTELGVPNINLTNTKYSYIKNDSRRLYADIVNLMDKSIGDVVVRLQYRNMLENSIILFFSDNGAQTIGLYQNFGSNWPLRGLKFTMFEGAVRGTGVIYSPLFRTTGYISRELIHLVDFLPTFYSVAGGNIKDLGQIDGVNQWRTLSENLPTNRTELLVHFDEVLNNAAIITHRGQYKLINGTYGTYEGYFGEDGRGPENPDYDVTSILNSPVNLAIQNLKQSTPINESQIKETRYTLNLLACRTSTTSLLSCVEKFCLIDLENDRCETRNLIDEYPEIARELAENLGKYWKEYVPQTNKKVDPRSNPALYNNTVVTWLDQNSGTTSKLSKDLIKALISSTLVLVKQFGIV